MFDVAQAWFDYKVNQESIEEPKPTAANTLLRCSTAGSCERQSALDAIHAMPTEIRSSETLLAFEVGNAIHASLQKMLLALDDYDVSVEVPVDLSSTGVSLSGHCDALLVDAYGRRIVVEIKTMSGYGASQTFGSSPKREHVAQAGLYALGLEADAVLIVYVAKESDRGWKVRPGQIAQWYYELDEEVFENQSVRDVVESELARFSRIQFYLNDGMLPRPLVQDSNKDYEMFCVDLPGPFGRPSKNHHWECRYCVYNSACAELGPEHVSLEKVKVRTIE